MVQQCSLNSHLPSEPNSNFSRVGQPLNQNSICKLRTFGDVQEVISSTYI